MILSQKIYTVKVTLGTHKTSLDTSPNRFNGVFGAARAARLAGDEKKAKVYYGQLIALSRGADGVRPEIQEAKAFLAGSLRDSASRR